MLTSFNDKNSSGLTLIELLLALGIVAILSTVGIPSFNHLIKKNRTDAVIKQLVTVLNYSRTLAVGRNTTITACLSNDGVNCQKDNADQFIVFQDNNFNKTIDADELIQIFQFDVEKDSLLLKVSAGRNYLRFRSNGAVIEYGRIQYCPKSKSEQYAQQVVINSVGRLRPANDDDDDGIVEGSDGKNIEC